MGIALQAACGVVAFAVARVIPWRRAGRLSGWLPELLAALAAAMAAGLAAAALDFGGWKEPDPRAALFSFFCALGAAGLVRGLK